MFYESTRDRNRKINPSEAILQGLSEEGGLFVLRDLGEKKLNLNEFKIEDFKVECFESEYYENNEKVYNISCGIMITGYLLVINLYSASKEEVENAIKYIYSIEKIE